MRIASVSLLAAVAAIEFLAGGAVRSRAADIPLKAPAATPAPSWTGWYVNAGGGYGMWAADTNTAVSVGPFDPAAPLNQRRGGQGWDARVGGGYDYQFNSRIVAGVFADFDFSELKGTVIDAVVGLSADIKQSRSWAVGGRAGWLVQPNFLTYFNGGYTSAHFSSGSMVAYRPPSPVPIGVPSGFVTPAFNQSGWFLGGGTEASLSGGWYWRNEYRYAYYGTHAIADVNVFATAPFAAFNNINFKPTVQTVTTQLVYKFNPGGAGAAYSAPASAVIAANWNGLYVSGGGGYGLWAADETTSNIAGGDFPVLVAQRHGGKGWLGRLGAGYDRRFNRFVAGVFGDFDFSSLKGSIADTGHGIDGTVTQRWSWAAGGRAGFLIDPNVLGYVDGGYTRTHFSSAILQSIFTGAQFAGSNTQAFDLGGWFVGGGMEYAFAPGWFWRNEYRYSQFGTANLQNNSDPALLIGSITSFKPAVQTVTTQVVYKFNSGL